MLKLINIKSLLQAKKSLSENSFEVFLKHYNIKIRDEEIVDLLCLSTALSDGACSARVFDQYYVGYKIPQIGKEFDLLRLGRNYIVNIELKSKSSQLQIKTQLLQNKNYLDFIGRTVYYFTFVSFSKELFFLRDDGELELANIEVLAELLSDQDIDDTEILDSLFNPSDYLVSPFNSTQKFLAGEYFLTHQQEAVKNQIIDSFKPAKTAKFFSVVGGAGTGKTLLAYDVVRDFLCSGKKPLIIHCGQLNDGHLELIKNGWTIVPIKNYRNYDLANFDLIIIDEAQRIYENQFDAIVNNVISAKCYCIFSHDKLQTLSHSEVTREISTKIGSIPFITQYKLSEKIRTNKEIAVFIKMLFNSKKSLPIVSNGNIQINFFSTSEDAKKYLDDLDERKWEVLRFTPSQYNNEHHVQYSETSSKTSHQVIGQEFDAVTVTIDQFFSYDRYGDLIYSGKAYYDPPKMLLQNISRCRKKLNVVIIGNNELLSRCISILQ